MMAGSTSLVDQNLLAVNFRSILLMPYFNLK